MKTNSGGIILTFVSFLCLVVTAYSIYMVLDGKEIQGYSGTSGELLLQT